jgi:MoxR-like ATPase
MLEAMQEKQVTVGNNTYRLDEPFYVLATQNPIEMEGTFPLPEAQLDRFLLKILLEYPSVDEELDIMKRYTGRYDLTVQSVASKADILALQKLCREVPVSQEIERDAVGLVTATRKWEGIQYGASPRASIGLILTSKARALLNGRKYVSREDLHVMAYPVLRHRIILSFEAERRGMTADQVITSILKEHKI